MNGGRPWFAGLTMSGFRGTRTDVTPGQNVTVVAKDGREYFRMHGRDYVTRLAPSPTGALHLGNARTFLITWLRCRQRGGRLILRVEDLDHPKIKHGAADGIYEDLRWLGIDWDEGSVPFDLARVPAQGEVERAARDFIQSRRSEVYAQYFRQLRERGLIYPCVCTRADILGAQSAPHPGEELRYPNNCRGRYASEEAAREATGRSPAWRFVALAGGSCFTDVFCGPQIADLQDFSGDFVVAREAGMPAYQLAVVVDDHLMNVSEVIRADDLLLSTHRQLALYAVFGWTPPDFLHVPLIVGPDGRRLAKRHGDTRISALRAAGVSPERVIGWLGWSCGLLPSAASASTVRELLPHFDLHKIPHTHFVADRQALLPLLGDLFQT